MTQEDKDLLLKDLCARLPYGVKIRCGEDIIMTLRQIDEDCFCECWENEDFICHSKWMLPYLRPMSSMTEEEIKELSEIDMKRVIFSSRHLTWHLDGEVIDYLNKKMFDWRSLISKGLALEAPENMYNIKEK